MTNYGYIHDEVTWTTVNDIEEEPWPREICGLSSFRPLAKLAQFERVHEGLAHE